MTNLGKLIDRRLNELQWERQQLAHELEIVPVSVSRWLRPEGDTPVSWRYYHLLSVVLRVPIREILRQAEKDSPQYVRLYRRLFGRKVWHGAEPARRRHV